MKRLTFIAIALSVAASVSAAHAQPPKGYPNCPFDNVQDCEMDASVSRNIELYNSGRYTRPDGTIDFDLMAKDAAAEKTRHTHAQQQAQQNKNPDKEVVTGFRPVQHCGYFPNSVDDPRWVLVPRDERPKQIWDCRMVYAPVYGKPWVPPKMVEYDYHKWGIEFKETIPVDVADKLDHEPMYRAERIAALSRNGSIK